MESHVLNPTYHQTRFRPIGHKVLRLKSDSISSESSCNQNSPEYPQISGSRQQNSEYSNGDWCIQNQTINTTHSSQDSTSDEESSDAEENIKNSQMVAVQDHDEDSDEELDDSIEECEVNVDDEGNVHQEASSLHPSPQHTMQHNVDNEDNVDHETDSIHSSPLHTMQHNFDDEDNVDQEAGSPHSSPLQTMQHNVDDEDNIDHETDSIHSSPLHTMQHKVDDEDNIDHETDSIHSSPLYTVHHNVDDEDNVDHETDSIHSSPPHIMQHNFDDEDNVDQEAGSLHSSPLHTMQHNVDDDDNVDQEQHNGPSSIEDHTLVEGDDYEIITVYTVNPDMIEPSSEDDAEDYAISEKDVPVNSEDNAGYINIHYNEKNSTPCQDGLDLNLDGPVVSNVDEYFITNNNNEQNILDSDEPVVKDVDEYFIKGNDIVKVPTFDDFFSKHPLPEEDSTQFKLPTSTAKVEHFLDANTNSAAQEKVKLESEPEQETVPDTNIADVSINESDLEILPNIEDIKRYLLDDIPYTKLRHNQKSCSLPQSPMQNLCMDIDDAKTSLSFEDLNLDLSDLTFENEKDKSASTNKSDDPPRTLTEEDVNSFLITDKPEDNKIKQEEDDFSPQDMEIESTIDTESTVIEMPSREMTSTPIPRVLDFCIEKTTVKKEIKDPKIDLDDFVDVESCNDTVIPVLEANNVNSLLEQFEATEKLNTKKRPAPVVKIDSGKVKSFNKNSLTNGMRLQDAGVQLNKNKMRQILMPTPINSTIGRSKSPVYSDHDYCSSKKRHSLPNLKGGRSLLKPEVLSSNSRILNSRHRSCKSKKVVYHVSSDEETEDNKSKNKKVKQSDDIDPKKKTSIKTSIKPPVQSNCRKKLSLPHSAPDSDKDKNNSSVMIKNACKASDTNSQNSNGSIRLTIKNKSEVILNCDHIDSQKVNVDNCNSVSDKTNNLEIKDKSIKELDRNKSKVISSIDTVTVKEEPRPKNENFYNTLFSNKQDVQIPQALQPKIEKRPFDHELNKCVEADVKREEQPQKRKKLNLQEYKLRRGVCSNNSSAQVSPEAIFPDMPSPGLDKAVKCPIIRTPPSSLLNSTDKVNNEQKFFDPIKEASRKILMNTKKQKAEAMRKRDENIVMSKIPKVENLQLQPLMTEAEMMKIVGMTPSEIMTVPIVKEKPQLPADYEEIILVSIGINTEENMFQKPKLCVHEENKEKSPPIDAKSLINFKIKKSDHILKQNVFDSVKRDKISPLDEKRHTDTKIDKKRYKDITATLKSVEKQVDTKISSNSLFASIQDVVMKKAPERNDDRHSNLRSPVEKRDFFTTTTIVRDYDPKAEHGEDKVILHLGKHRCKPTFSSAAVQTNLIPEFAMLASSQTKVIPASRRRNDSDMSLSSDGSPARTKEIPKEQKQRKSNERVLKPKEVRTERVEIDLKEKKRSRSKDRSYRRRSRSVSRGRRRRSRSRSLSRSRGRYRRYKRSHSPYKRKRRSRSPYHKRRSPSVRRERSKFSRSRSRSVRPTRPEARSKTPMMKSKQVPHTSRVEKNTPKSLTPPLRKSTVSESSDSSSSSASSSSSSSTSSSSSSDSRHSKRSCSSYNRDETYKRQGYRSYSSEDRESNTPVEERRIVFVGRLEKDITKAHLRNLFSKFGAVMEVRLHSKEDGSRYGFVTYQRARDAWSAVEAASTFPQYDVGFGGRRAFCRQSYADLDGLEAKYTESAFHGAAALPVRRNDDMSFEQMLLEMKKKLSQRKIDKKRED